MEPDSTTYEKYSKTSLDDEKTFPFNVCPENLELYNELIANNGDRIHEMQVVERLQNFGLLPNSMKCPTDKSDCKMTCRVARVVDRVQWYCEGCGKRQPIRAGSFFLRLQSSIIQALQIILAWCEDADLDVAAEHFGVKPKSVSHIYDKLDEVVIKEYSKHKLGGPDSVVLADLYPDCTNRLSPDTTDHPHQHRILMLADTKHVPTYYRLHLLKDEVRKSHSTTMDSNQALKSQVEEIISNSVEPGSMLVTGQSLPALDGAYSVPQLPRCDTDMQYFLSTRVWRQAIALCAASRDLCAGAALAALCAPAVQRYLQAAAYRLRARAATYRRVLRALAADRPDLAAPAHAQ